MRLNAYPLIKLLILTLFVLVICFFTQQLLDYHDYENSRIIITILKGSLFCFLVFLGKNYFKILNISFPKLRMKEVAFGLSAALGLLIINLITFLPFNRKIFISSYEIQPKIDLVFILVIVFYPLIEELYFRYFVCNVLLKKYSSNKTIIFSAILFTLGHLFADTGLVAVLFAGLLLAYIYVRTKNLTLVVIIHYAINLLNYPMIKALGVSLENFILPNNIFFYWYILFLAFGLSLLFFGLKNITKQT